MSDELDAQIDQQWMLERVDRIIHAAIDGKSPEQINAITNEIAARYDAAGGFFVCCSLAEAVAVMADMTDPPEGGFYGFMLRDSLGRPVDPESVSPQARPYILAMRFLVTYVNEREPGEETSGMFDAFNNEVDGPMFFWGLVQLVRTHAQRVLASGGRVVSMVERYAEPDSGRAGA